MKSMRRDSRDKGARGLLEYNASLRTDIEKPVWHQTLRLPKGKTLSDAVWMAIADRYMDLMGFSNVHPRAVFLEDDPNGQHVHIVASRVAPDGTEYLGSFKNALLGHFEREGES